MYYKLYIKTVLLVMIAVLSSITIASADDDYIEARELLQSGKILSLETILKRVRQDYPGKVLEVELEKENGKIVYEIEILSDKGIVKEIYVDAESGNILSAKEDD